MNGITVRIVVCTAGIFLAGSAYGQSEFQRVAVLSGDYSGLPDQNAAEGPEFGHDVAMDGDWLAVGAPGTAAESSMGIVGEEGAVFLFQRQGDGWEHHETLITGGRRCGTAVALSFPHLAFGCPSASGNSHVHFYTYAPTENAWSRTGGFATGAECGVSVAMTEVHPLIGTAIAAVGCPSDDTFQNVRIWAFDPDDTDISPQGRWNFATSVSPSDGAAGDRFGQSVALWQSDSDAIYHMLAVGAPYKDHFNPSFTAENSGSVYFYEGPSWMETEVLVDPEANGSIRPGLLFGASLAVSETELFVGAPGSVLEKGFIAYFNRPFPGYPWAYRDSFQAFNKGGDPEGEQWGMRFGDAVAIGPGNLVAVAAPYADGIHEDGGEVELRKPELQVPFGYFLTYRGEVRPGNARPGQLFEQGHFGTSVDFGNGQLAVGFPHAGFNNVRSGRVWIYEIDRIFADRFEE